MAQRGAILWMTGGDSGQFAVESTSMPRKVDYASRFQFLREAAFAIVRDHGIGGLSRRALADQLGTSRNRVDDILRAEADLRVLAAGEVKSRRNSGRFGLLKGAKLDVAVNLVTSLMPDTPARIDEELVWLRLLIEGPRASPPVEDPDGPLWARYQIAQRGHVYQDRPALRVDPTPAVDAMAEHRAERETLVASRLDLALETLDVDPEHRPTELARLHAIVDGITVAVCLGRVTAPAGVRIVRDHLARLTPQCRPPG